MAFWTPKSLSIYEAFFSEVTSIDNLNKQSYAIRKNLGYNSQYIEYLVFSLKNNEFHSVIGKQLQKSLILTVSSNVESIIYCILKRSNNHKTTNWKEMEKFHSNKKLVDGAEHKIESVIYKNVDPIEDYMTFDWMINKCQSKRLLGNNQIIYDHLKRTKKLRNKIHLYVQDHELDTDYNNFNDTNTELVLSTYKSILLSKVFENRNAKKIFDYF